MLFTLIFRIVSSAAVLLYPTYASYKTLSKRPANEADIERWLMYWSVLGVIIATEYVAEWAISWIPFYYLLKTAFLLYLALPQTQGSTYIYTRHLYPFLHTHENEIDRTVVEAKSRLSAWIRIKLRAAWEGFGGVIPSSTANTTIAGRRSATPDTPPALLAPMTNPLQLAVGLWRTYSPAIGAFLQQPTSTTPPVARSPSPGPGPESHNPLLSQPQTSAVEIHPSMDSKLSNREAILARRRALEAELAALNAMPEFEPSPIHIVGTTAESSDTGASSSTFAATLASTAFSAMSTYLPTSSAPDDKGRYEEIARGELEEEDDNNGIHQIPKKTSWWWRSGDQGYERLKTE